MAVTIKSEREIGLMREAGRVLGLVHEELRKAVKPGVTTKDLDRLAETMIRDFGCKPSFLHLYDYPASVCI
ncbi:MAG: M24 family metallopeptidase, partial [Lachnospiraceae bacterium]|nr:M24 family metallopeptidase [Lachnospiraceae bacterium]